MGERAETRRDRHGNHPFFVRYSDESGVLWAPSTATAQEDAATDARLRRQAVLEVRPATVDEAEASIARMGSAWPGWSRA